MTHAQSSSPDEPSAIPYDASNDGRSALTSSSSHDGYARPGAPVTAHRPRTNRAPQVSRRAKISPARPAQTPTMPQSKCSAASVTGTNTPTAENSIDHIKKRVSPAP